MTKIIMLRAKTAKSMDNMVELGECMIEELIKKRTNLDRDIEKVKSSLSIMKKNRDDFTKDTESIKCFYEFFCE